MNENNLIGEDHIKDFFRSKLFTGLYTNLKEPLHSFPISYRIDNRKSVSDPIGMKANNLLTKWHIISVSKDYLEIIYKTFLEMDLNLKQIVSSNYATSLAVLNEEESDQGAITIEVQKNKTVFFFIKKKKKKKKKDGDEDEERRKKKAAWCVCAH